MARDNAEFSGLATDQAVRAHRFAGMQHRSWDLRAHRSISPAPGSTVPAQQLILRPLGSDI